MLGLQMVKILLNGETVNNTTIELIDLSYLIKLQINVTLTIKLGF